MPLKRHQLRSSMVWSLVEALTILLTSVVVSLLAGRIIGTSAFGLASLAFFIGSLAETLIVVPFSEPLIRRQSYSLRVVDAAFTGSFIAGLSIFALLVMSAPLVASMYGNEQLQWLIMAQSTTSLLLGIRGIPEAVLVRKLRFKSLARRNIAAKLVGAAVTVALAYGGAGAWSIVLGNVTFAVASTLMVLAILKRWPRFSSEWHHARELLGFGVFSAAHSFVGGMTPRVFNFLIGYLHGVAAAGQTSIAFRINDGIGALLYGVTSRMALPVFSRLVARQEEFRKALADGTRICFLLAAPVFLGTAFISEDLVFILLGPDWGSAATALVAVNLFSLCNFACLLAAAAVTALGHPARWLVVQLAGLTFVTLGCVVTARMNLAAPLVVWGLFGLVYVLASTSILKWTSGVGYGAQLSPLFRISLALVGMSAALLVFKEMTSLPLGIARLACEIVIGAGAYTVLITILEYRTVRQIISRRSESESGNGNGNG
ncbi:MAG: hypothetical protein JWQ73_637 [Variovorax sp.]|jgi:O-antigen/teichoic acid export membrane protein|nr:hypothetical protein [Variovorax sp.]